MNQLFCVFNETICKIIFEKDIWNWVAHKQWKFIKLLILGEARSRQGICFHWGKKLIFLAYTCLHVQRTSDQCFFSLYFRLLLLDFKPEIFY